MAIEKETYVIGGPFKIRESGATTPSSSLAWCPLSSRPSRPTRSLCRIPPPRRAVSTMPFRASLRSGCRSTSANSRPASWLPWCGDATNVPSATHTDEAHTAVPGGTIALDFMPLEITSVKSDDGSTTYEEFDDWNMTGAGIEIVEGGDLCGHADQGDLQVRHRGCDRGADQQRQDVRMPFRG